MLQQRRTLTQPEGFLEEVMPEGIHSHLNDDSFTLNNASSSLHASTLTSKASSSSGVSPSSSQWPEPVTYKREPEQSFPPLPNDSPSLTDNSLSILRSECSSSSPHPHIYLSLYICLTEQVQSPVGSPCPQFCPALSFLFLPYRAYMTLPFSVKHPSMTPQQLSLDMMSWHVYGFTCCLSAWKTLNWIPFAL